MRPRWLGAHLLLVHGVHAPASTVCARVSIGEPRAPAPFPRMPRTTAARAPRRGRARCPRLGCVPVPAGVMNP